ncbi:MAG: hypothetical protein OEO23_15335, partial [Gemmatimonadota bacterium]|nr:hypothetical protein [Gemmatimonadota bacterium]
MRRRNLGRARWPLVAGALVAVSAAFPKSPLVDGATGGDVPFAVLDQPVAYLLFAPLFGLWDTLALLTLKQHYALLATLVFLYLLKRIRAPRSRLKIPGRMGMELVRALGALLLLLGFYAAGTLLPRPMVGLALSGQSRLAVDFHSHTLHSHDGWSLFTAARNRSWHEAGGFDVGYVTDHYTWRGVDDATLNNPAVSGERTVLLSGVEVRIRRRHVNLLGDRTRYAFALDSTWHHLDPDSVAAGVSRGGPPPTILYTLPGPLDELVPYSQEVPGGVIGVELNDGAPRGLEQVKEERERILALADEHDLALVAGANLHGWGRTVTAWSVMDIPAWRSMTPDALGDAIEAV